LAVSEKEIGVPRDSLIGQLNRLAQLFIDLGIERNRCDERLGTVRLCNPDEICRKILQVTRLDNRFDVFADASGFRFAASNGATAVSQGDEISLQADTRLKIKVPVSGRVVVFKDGQALLDDTGVTEKDLQVSERGVYRVEVYLPQLGKPVGEQPWIISNPIYVR